MRQEVSLDMQSHLNPQSHCLKPEPVYTTDLSHATHFLSLRQQQMATPTGKRRMAEMIPTGVKEASMSPPQYVQHVLQHDWVVEVASSRMQLTLLSCCTLLETSPYT